MSAAPTSMRLKQELWRYAATVVLFGVLAGLILTPLYRVYSPAALLFSAGWGALLGMALVHFAVSRRWNALITVSIGLATAYLGGLLLRIFGALTSGDAVDVKLVTESAAGIVRVWKDMLTLEPRFGLDSATVLAPFLIAFITAGAGGCVALRVGNARRATWAALIPLLGYVLATLLGWRTAFYGGAASILIAALLLLWIAWWPGNFQPRRYVSLLVTLALLGATGLALAPMTIKNAPRYVLRDELAPPFDPRDFPSPLSGYRTFIKEYKDTDLFTVSGLPAGTPIRIAAMDDFDGVVWNVSGAHDAEGSGTFRRIGDQLQPGERGIEHTVEIEVHALDGPWLPTVGWLKELRFTSEIARSQRSELRYNDSTGTALMPPGLTPNTSYELTAIVPSQISDDALLRAKAGSVVLPEPKNVPDAVITAASAATREASSPIGIARALEQSLSEQGWFSNGQTVAGDYPSLAGHGAARLVTLLTGDLMVGNDEQYASAMALMGRSAGLPTRVVMGFIPEADAADDSPILDDVTIQGGDVHAWVEIQFAGSGWVPFFPTPPESQTPAEDTPQDTHESQPQVLQPPLPPPDQVKPPDTDTERPQSKDTTEEETDGANYLLWIAVGGGVSLVVLLWLLPLLLIMALKRRRRNRRRKRSDPIDQVTGGWDELVDVTVDVNGSARFAPVRATRAEFAFEIAVLSRELVPEGSNQFELDVLDLARGADAAVFSPTAPDVGQAAAYWGEVDRVTRSLRRAVARKRRRKARWNTVSLKYRRSERRGAQPQRRKK